MFKGMLTELELGFFRRAAVSRHFENRVFKLVKDKVIKFPVYLSAGQEYIAATLSVLIQEVLGVSPLIFAQHRAHSTYLSFGGDRLALIDELLGQRSGCANGMGGSASIHCPGIKMYGHDGLMGSQVPIAVGACYASKEPTIVFMGDASAEEDYVLGALGWAQTKKLPILFVVEDNNLSILTEKKVRRSWEMYDVAKSFGMLGFNITDSPEDLCAHHEDFFKTPMLLNVNTHRLYWHAGAGIDSDDIFDRYAFERDKIGSKAYEIDGLVVAENEKLWSKQLEIRYDQLSESI